MRSPSGALVGSFEHSFTGLLPNHMQRYNTDTWSSAGIAPGTYLVLASVYYDSRVATGSARVTLTGAEHVFLPLIKK